VAVNVIASGRPATGVPGWDFGVIAANSLPVGTPVWSARISTVSAAWAALTARISAGTAASCT